MKKAIQIAMFALLMPALLWAATPGEDASTRLKNQTADSKMGETGTKGGEAGKTYGNAQPSSTTNYNSDLRNSVNGATSQAMGHSAYIDSLFSSGQINREGWMKLKSQMTQSMMGEIEKSKPGAPLPQAQMPSAPSSPKQVGTPEVPVAREEKVPAPAPRNSSRTPASIPEVEDDSEVVGAGGQILDLSAAGRTVFGGTLVPDTVSGSATAAAPIKDSEEQIKEAQATAYRQAVAAEVAEKEGATDHEKAMLLAQKLLQEHKLKTAGAAARPGDEKIDEKSNPEKFRQEHARAMLSLQGLKKVKRVQDSVAAETEFTPEQIVSAVTGGTDSLRNPASVITNPWGKEEPIYENQGVSHWGLFFMGLLGLFAGLAVAYGLFLRPQKPLMQLMVPGSGEHFTVRPGTRSGEFILDIMDVRGNLVRTAGTLRPDSVARAAVLPPDLAARLGAKGAFDRFEFTRDGEFVRTEKEEGYQVFPFVLK